MQLERPDMAKVLGINAALGAWLIVSPYILGFGTNATIT